MTIETRKNRKGEVISYRVRACVGRDEMGRQVWRTKTYERPEGLTPKRAFDEVKRQADAWEQEQKEEYQQTNAKTDDKSKITLAKFINEHWMPVFVLDGTHKPNGIIFYQNMATIIISHFGPKKKLAQVDYESVKRFIGWLNKEARTQKGEPYSAETRVHIYGALRNILNYAKRTRYIKENPCDFLTVKEKPHKEQRQVDFLTEDQAKQFLECLKHEPLFWQAYINILLFCGLRRSEALALTWKDIDTDKMLLNVSRNVTADKDSPNGYAIITPKSGKGRTVPISKRLLSMLMQLKCEREEKLQVKLFPTMYIFSRTDNPQMPLYVTTPTAWMRRFTKRNNLPPASPHDLRHTCATLMLAAKGKERMKDVQLLLGHSDIAVTLRHYAGSNEESRRDASEGLENLIG